MGYTNIFKWEINFHRCYLLWPKNICHVKLKMLNKDYLKYFIEIMFVL